jgi:hypothetical protein
MHFSYNNGMKDVGFFINQCKMLATFHREGLGEI